MAKNSVRKLGSGKRNQWLKTLATDDAKTDPGNRRVLIDTNVWYGALLYGGNPELVVRRCKRYDTIVSSPYLLNKLLSLLKERGAPYKWRNDLERVLKRMTQSFEPDDFSGISRDPKDDPIIASAIAGGCDYLITNDGDLLELGGYKQLKILKPLDYLKIK